MKRLPIEEKILATRIATTQKPGGREFLALLLADEQKAHTFKEVIDACKIENEAMHELIHDFVASALVDRYYVDSGSKLIPRYRAAVGASRFSKCLTEYENKNKGESNGTRL